MQFLQKHSIFVDISFFTEQERKDQIIGELMRYIYQPRDLPLPTECGRYRSRIKEWLPQADVFVYYWDYGRVWEFFGIVEKGNYTQLDELEKLLDKMESENSSI